MLELKLAITDVFMHLYIDMFICSFWCKKSKGFFIDNEFSVMSKMKVDFYLIFWPPQNIVFLNSILGVNVEFWGQILTSLIL